MRAISIRQPGPPDVLQLTEVPVPQLKAGEVLIKVHAAGVNRPDVLQRLGHYPVPPGASELPGLEVAGEIVQGDLSGSHFKMGDMVCALVQGGGYAEYCAAPLQQCLPVPAGLSALEAASLPETFFTVWSNVFDRSRLAGDDVLLVQGGGYAEYCAAPLQQCLPVPAGLSALEAASLPETFFTVWSNVFDRSRLAGDDVLLVQGGSSGIGVTAIQMAAAMGHRVFATAGSDDKCRACEALGAERAINYRTEDFVAVVKELTGGRGADVILDMVAGDYVAREIDCLADDGRIALIALLGGSKATVDLGQVLRRRLSISGSTLRPRPIAFKAAIAWRLQEKVWPLIELGKIKPVIYRTFPLQEAAAAHALMESSAHVGKIMLQVA